MDIDARADLVGAGAAGGAGFLDQPADVREGRERLALILSKPRRPARHLASVDGPAQGDALERFAPVAERAFDLQIRNDDAPRAVSKITLSGYVWNRGLEE